MAEKTAIAWTDHTFNPWIGCTRVSPGCDSCYAAKSRPVVAMEIAWGPGAPRRRTSVSNWHQPRKWNEQAKKKGERALVFCASLADVFDNEVDPKWRADLWQLIRETPCLTWQLVTKRIGNVPRMLPPDWGRGWANVWLVSTIVNQEEADRDLRKLLDVPAVLHGVSYEPALGPVIWTPYLSSPFAYGVDWIIVGGESDQPGSRARQFPVSWARFTIDQCRAAGVPVFVKQLGSNPFVSLQDGFDPAVMREAPKGYKWDEPARWPEWLRAQEFPK